MNYVNSSDYEYIMNKYHDVRKPFNSFKRFVRHDEIFPADTGMDCDAIRSGMLEQDESLKTLPHPVRKARAFEYILKNTRISCDSRDRFPAINMIDRPLNSTLISQWKKEVFEEIIPDVEARRAQLENDGIVTIWPDFDHSVPRWDRVFSLGFEGLLRESEAAREGHAHPEAQAFFDGIRITYEAVIEFTGRLASLAARTAGSERMAEALSRIQHGAPSTFYEALLTDYLYFILCEHIEGLQVRSLCNFDRLIYPYYRRDLENGVSEQELRSDLAYFLLQFTAIGNYWNQPVYLGGENEDGSSIINDLSYLFLDVYDQLGIYNPKVQIKVSGSTPKDFLLKALDMIRHGHNSIVFVSDPLIRKSLMKAGATEEQARLCDVKGCYEYAVQGAYDSSSMDYVNLLKPLEFALHEGYDGARGAFSGLKSPRAEEYESFEAFYSEYKRQLSHLIDQVIDISNAFEIYLPYINPLSMLSATVPTCLERAKDVMDGGAVQNGSVMLFGFIADAADSLTNIKKYVFDNRRLTLGELRDILDADFQGHELLRLQLRGDADKYGNNRELPDFFAKDLSEFVCSCVCGRPNSKKRGGSWNCGFHVARMSYTQAPMTAASPNGRHKGDELSKNISSSMGQNRQGATAAILSATKIDASSFTSDAALDLALLPSAVRGADGLEAMYSLLNAFVELGGHALHINVFDADLLRLARQHPEKYQDLQIRVCGWNVLWNNINPKEQDEFIRQAEALV